VEFRIKEGGGLLPLCPGCRSIPTVWSAPRLVFPLVSGGVVGAAGLNLRPPPCQRWRERRCATRRFRSSAASGNGGGRVRCWETISLTAGTGLAPCRPATSQRFRDW